MRWKNNDCLRNLHLTTACGGASPQGEAFESGVNMKKSKKDKRILGNSYSPYQTYGDDMNAWFEAYNNDPEKSIEIDGKIYVKILHRCEFYIRGDYTFLVAFEIKETLQIGDALVDELGHEFKVNGYEMIRYSTSSMPEWAGKVIPMSITGQDFSIGNYLAKK